MQQYAVICGEYGTGKSYTLLFIARQLSVEPFNSNVIRIYVENPGNSVQEFYRSSIQGMGSSTLKDLARKLVGKVSLRIAKEIVTNCDRGDLHEEDFLIELSGSLTFDSMWPRVAEIENIRNDDLAKVITWLGLDEEERKHYAWKWLTAAPLTALEMRMAKISRSLEGSSVAEVLNRLLQLAHKHLGKAIIIMVDEFEDILSIKEELGRLSFLQGLRRLIDGAPRSFGLLIACTAEGWRDGVLSYHPLASRLLKENFLTLNELDMNETEKFISDYLEAYRTEPAKSALFPFTEGAIEAIFRISHGNPREIVKTCRICLRAKSAESSAEITHNDVDRYFGETSYELL